MYHCEKKKNFISITCPAGRGGLAEVSLHSLLGALPTQKEHTIFPLLSLSISRDQHTIPTSTSSFSSSLTELFFFAAFPSKSILVGTRIVRKERRALQERLIDVVSCFVLILSSERLAENKRAGHNISVFDGLHLGQDGRTDRRMIYSLLD
jgi:hypothetical protein